MPCVTKVPDELNLEWKICQPAPEPMDEGSIAVKDKYVYVNPAHSDFVYEYDSIEDRWRNKIQCSRTSFALVIVDGLLTLVGGQISDSNSSAGTESSSENESLDVITNSIISFYNGHKTMWREYFKPMKKKRRNAVACCTTKHLVVAGGYSDPPKQRWYCRDIPTCLEVEVMEIGTKQWNTAQNLPKCHGALSSGIIFGDNLYVCFTTNQVESYSVVLTCTLSALLQSCNPNPSNIIQPLLWQKLKPLSELHKPFVAHLCGVLVVAGGKKEIEIDHDYFDNRIERYGFSPAVYAYDCVKGWKLISHLPADIGFPKVGFLVATLPRDKLVVCGGRVVSGGSYLASTETLYCSNSQS